MKIQYLGTAAAEGWPALFCNCDSCLRARAAGGKNIRTRSQAIIDDTLLIDYPPDGYLHMLQQGVNLPGVQNLLVTHSHQDHFYPLDLTLRSPYFAHKIQGTLQIYGNDAVHEEWNKAVTYIGGDMATSICAVYNEVEPFVPFQVQDYIVTPLLALHKRTERCYIYIIEKNGKRLLYANDTGLFPQITWDYIRGIYFDLVSMDCTMLKIPEGTTHMGIDDNIKLRQMLTDSGCVDKSTKYVITHFSHNGVLLHEEIEQRVAPQGFQVAYDGLAVEF